MVGKQKIQTLSAKPSLYLRWGINLSFAPFPKKYNQQK